jgi:hypothetical protein
VSSVVASNGDTFTAEPGATITSGGGGGAAGMVVLYRCLSSAGMAASGTLTVNWNAGATGMGASAQFTAVTSASLTDTNADAANTSNHTDGATGLTTSGDVLIIAMGQLGGAGGTIGVGTYTAILTTSTSAFQYKASASGLTADQGAWTSSTARQNRGAMAAFYAAGGSVGQPTVRRFGVQPSGLSGVRIY